MEKQSHLIWDKKKNLNQQVIWDRREKLIVVHVLSQSNGSFQIICYWLWQSQ